MTQFWPMSCKVNSAGALGKEFPPWLKGRMCSKGTPPSLPAFGPHEAVAFVQSSEGGKTKENKNCRETTAESVWISSKG